MRLKTFIKANSILYGFNASSCEAALALFAETLAIRGLIENESAVRDGLASTESGHSTAIGNGVAIPHASVEELERRS